MKKLILASALFAGSFASHSLYASSMENVGLGINYGAFSGPSLELSYPISDTVQVRGALSGGMGLSETAKDTDIEYDVEADGGIHRIALDYHPFANGFFLSAGYAINNFELDASGSKSGSVTVGNDTFTGDVNINANIAWDNAPTLSLGWGHSPQQGLGFMIEAGAFFTGSPNTDINGTCTGTCTGFDEALKDEEVKLQKDVADYDFLPMLQAGITYRF
ncbi:hypothetical protein [Thiomicrorhabdus sp. Kp2]|uniref:hypothetical protein n=1 Tax=Thiomicrorhabdus sp. Kp2 TaxID=1123518 RepID=UPI0003FD0C2F|nr:hypothetical protein [Thiomicrorhabdus sp. Kp2]